MTEIQREQNNIKHIMELNLSFIERRSFISLDFVRTQLDNIVKLIGNEQFYDEVYKTVFNFLDADSDGDIDNDDIKLIKETFKEGGATKLLVVTTNLVEAIVSLIAKFDRHKLKFDPQALEDIVIGTIIYVIFQYLPEEDEDEYYSIVEMILNIYVTMKSIGKATGVIDDIKRLFKKKGICGCCKADKEAALDDRIERANHDLNMGSKSLKKDGQLIKRVHAWEEKNERAKNSPKPKKDNGSVVIKPTEKLQNKKARKLPTLPNMVSDSDIIDVHHNTEEETFI
jgi:hypothetical protein